MAGGSASDVGSGGMATKIAAGKIAVAAGCHMCVAIGREHRIRCVASRRAARCTWFVADALADRRCASNGSPGCCKPPGALHVDEGAVRALRAGRSLLPAGVDRDRAAVSIAATR